ncbi:U3 small nucleolar RNA-interacting protein 2 [Hondaea fermentalgiana]|uniref:U3 small nucleolar RNA-interacting protein 2 n=1 Tax=Hondaea fermentalgiana TaxID=2315210 RepID=A0A2R5GMT0_9STRA|nr:U3 small nucleolar RNA-interacting protein 2 [Hondaea fermentalgiana]|eukprot:GBG31038.1 U3 small nucleolar RNA-interacting protein 2 [Hondaea fermentalgiana]
MKHSRETRTPANGTKRPRREAKLNVDWDLDSNDEDSDVDDHRKSQEDTLADAQEHAETPAEKRLRVAREILAKVQASQRRAGETGSDEDGSGSDEDDDDDTAKLNNGLDPVTQKLHHDLLRAEGRLRRPVAAALKQEDISYHKCPRTHRLSVTCIALTGAEDVAYTGSKDCSIVRWDVETGKRVTRFPGRPATKQIAASSIKGHHDEVLAVAVSTDGRYLASGGKDKVIHIWDARSNTLVDSFSGHRDAVSGLTFLNGKHTLYSSSFDRSVRAWNVDEMAYIESLFGHQAPILGIDCLYRERAVTCSMDRSVRYWKFPEESQLVLQGVHKSSIDTIAMADETHFVSGSQEGTLALWSTAKKKPSSIVRRAHGDSWICSVAAMPNADIAASGAADGYVKLWNVDTTVRRIKAPSLMSLPVPGYVNALAFGASGRVLLAGCGQEHRLGRWERKSGGRNTLHIFRLPEYVHDLDAAAALKEAAEEAEREDAEAASDEEGDDK